MKILLTKGPKKDQEMYNKENLNNNCFRISKRRKVFPG
jgi:hypothetical protein